MLENKNLDRQRSVVDQINKGKTKRKADQLSNKQQVSILLKAIEKLKGIRKKATK